MDQIEDPQELKREIERANRRASVVGDQKAAWRRDGQKKRSGRAQENFGKPVAARPTGTWNFLVEGRRGIAESRDPLSPTEDVLGKTSGKDAPGQPLYQRP